MDTEEIARRHYCVSLPDGTEDPERMHRVQAVLEQRGRRGSRLPEVPGVPRLRLRIDHVSQIAEAVRRFLPEVEADPRLHALSFVDPLRVANELGIALTPPVARTVRRLLAGAVSFDVGSLDYDGALRGIGEIRWRPKAHRVSR